MPFLSVCDRVYLCGLIGVEFYACVLHRILSLDERVPFLSLLLRSVYGGVGMGYCWLRFVAIYLSANVQLNVVLYAFIWKRKQTALKTHLILADQNVRL